MNLAVILGISLLSIGFPGLVYPSVGMPAPAVFGFAAQQPTSPESSKKSPDADSSAQPQAPPSGAAKAPSGPASHHKKKSPPCSNSPSALNPAPGNTGDSANAAGTGTGKSDPSSAASANTGSTDATSPSKSAAPLKPCPPPKKVVRNGGSEEPSIQIVGGTTAGQASQQRSTEQLTAATEENLRKIAGRPLNPNQQELVNQVKQFMDQSKTAVSTGDLEGGHNLAQKAHLLSQELLKP